MPKAVVMTGAGAPDVLKWTDVPWVEPAAGQVRIKVRAAGISPTDLALRSGRLKAFSLSEDAVLGFQVAGTVDAVGPSVTGAHVGDEVVAFLLQLGGYAEYAIASIWTPKPATVSWTDAAALPSAAEATVRVLRELEVRDGERLVLFGGAGAVGTIATQLAARQGVTVISAVGRQDLDFARELGAVPVQYGEGVVERIRALGGVNAVFDAAGAGVLADAITLTGRPDRVITLSDPAAARFGVRLSGPDAGRAAAALADVAALLAEKQLRLRPYTVAPMSDAGEVHRRLESGELHGQVVLAVD
ncbi:MAG TPA: NADP-dependent oxidoreductase [Lentzea sp.]